MSVLKIHPSDNVVVALSDLKEGILIRTTDFEFRTQEKIQSKHKVALKDLAIDEEIIMYGTTVGRATQPIPRGGGIHTSNIRHDIGQVSNGQHAAPIWQPPDVQAFRNLRFHGYHRSDGQVGTRNFWLIIPLVFCENRNVKVLQESLLSELGYHKARESSLEISPLIRAFESGEENFEQIELKLRSSKLPEDRIFPNIDGIKFMTHEGGCGGTREDSDMLCRLLATYINHPNVGGATILSLGCQNAQIKDLKAHLAKLNPDLDKPVLYFEQQGILSERQFLENIIKKTFAGLVQANKIARQPAELHHLTLGLECGGSDGFSGISANPALGHTSDLLIALGGKAILSEFPELHGAEQEMVRRCRNSGLASKFLNLMDRYQQRARQDGSGFEANPSPGNIKDGLITDAIKSLGAARKGGTSPIVGVLDYGEVATDSGLHLLCTPGNDVESTTGLASAGANVIVFTTGLGTPTGNAVAPTIKISTNSKLAKRMADIIDLDAGGIIDGTESIESIGRNILKLIIETANGTFQPAAEKLGQDDFIPWKRGISL